MSGTSDLKEVKTNYRYVRGHMCPKNAADRMGLSAGWNTHTVLNAVPQLQWQNNGIWKQLENEVTDWADKYDSVWVICGPVFFDKTPAVWLGQKNEVKAAVPDALYKIIIRKSDESDSGIETL
ncbi:MAG: DNA/RNA non-specific endonuclease [Bacteroidetes bacterium]|nr:DNA/RNA non-specific endonuclease [Bacteroidota bacterium]